MRASTSHAVVRRRPDGIVQIAPKRFASPARDPYAGTVAAMLVGSGLFVATLVTLPVWLAIVAPWLAAEVWRARRVRRTLRFPPAPVEDLDLRRIA
jgi:hypothetical protein